MVVKNTIQYLRVFGTLYPDNRIRIYASYLVDNPRNPKEDPKSRVVAELYNEEEEILLRHRLSAKPYCVGTRVLPGLALRGDIPFPAGTRSVRFLKEDVAIHEIRVSEGVPVVKITWEPRANVKGKHGITWTGGHTKEQRVKYFLRYTRNGGKTWQPVGDLTEKTAQEVDFDLLPGGKRCRIVVVATDGVNTVTAETNVFSVSIKPCKAMIQKPGDGSVFALNSTVLLLGQGFYMEENRAETEALNWTSSINGKLGKGRLLEVEKLSPGTHRVTLTAGTGKRVGEASISIRIRKGNE